MKSAHMGALGLLSLVALLGGCQPESARAHEVESAHESAESASAAVTHLLVSAAPRAAAPPATASSPPLSDQAPCPRAMRWIPGGTLSTLERGKDVELKGFCLDEREVSVADFRACLKDEGCRRECAPAQATCSAIPQSTEWNPLEDTNASRFCNGNLEGREDHPLNCVSFGEAEAFCKAKGKRLPNGDEWEWASRGGPTQVASPWGAPIATNQICWGRPKKRVGTCALDTFAGDRTPQGVRGLGGNVSEWTSPPQRNGKVSAARWAYGASWYAIDDGYARAALGGVQMPAKRAETVGFRCAQ